MTWVDAYRIGLFVLAGIGAGFMVGTNILAFTVLRPPKRLGFLWWHVTAISISFICISSVAFSGVLDRMVRNVPFTWEGAVLGAGFALFAGAQVIIFTVEKSRFVEKRAVAESSELDRHPAEES